MNRLQIPGLLLAGLLAGLHASPPVFADPAPGATTTVRSTVVRYGDLDLEREADARALYERLRTAAARVCRSADDRDLRAVADQRRCRQDALTAAILRLPAPHVAALHAAAGRARIAQAGR